MQTKNHIEKHQKNSGPSNPAPICKISGMLLLLFFLVVLGLFLCFNRSVFGGFLVLGSRFCILSPLPSWEISSMSARFLFFFDVCLMPFSCCFVRFCFGSFGFFWLSGLFGFFDKKLQEYLEKTEISENQKFLGNRTCRSRAWKGIHSELTLKQLLRTTHRHFKEQEWWSEFLHCWQQRLCDHWRSRPWLGLCLRIRTVTVTMSIHTGEAGSCLP